MSKWTRRLAYTSCRHGSAVNCMAQVWLRRGVQVPARRPLVAHGQCTPENVREEWEAFGVPPAEHAGPSARHFWGQEGEHPQDGFVGVGAFGANGAHVARGDTTWRGRFGSSSKAPFSRIHVALENVSLPLAAAFLAGLMDRALPAPPTTCSLAPAQPAVLFSIAGFYALVSVFFGGSLLGARPSL